METRILLLCLNSKGRAIQVVGPFATDADAVNFWIEQASPAYHGYTLVDLTSPADYRTR